MKKFIFSAIILALSFNVIYAQDYALQFDGTDEYVTTSYSSRIQTISFWFKTDDFDQHHSLFGQRYDSNEESGNWQMHWDEQGDQHLRIYAYDSNGDGDEMLTTTAFETGKWYHVAVTSDGTTLKYYVNGEWDSSHSWDIILGAGSNDDGLYIGGSGENGSVEFFNGTIDEVKVWDEVRTEAKIQEYICCGLSGNETNLIAYYTMSDGSGSSLTDNSSNSHTGTLHNMEDGDWVTDYIVPARDGTSGTPYQIAGFNNLYWLSQTSSDWNKYFEQTNDIDLLVTQNWDDDHDGTPEGFSPIGNNSTNFTGSYDGFGYTIDNLYIDLSSTDYVGLFGYVNGTSISNLVLTNLNITGHQYVAGLAGYEDGNNVISNCTIGGTISGTLNTGGCIGFSNSSGNITSTSFSGNVDANNSDGDLASGGFVGQKSGTSTISQCSSSGTITGYGRNFGGFVGWHDNGTIEESYSTMDVSNTTATQGRIGGFAGSVSNYSGTDGTVNNCYSTGDVSAPNSTNDSNYGIGGFVGAYFNDGGGGNKVSYSYSAGSVSAPNASTNVGGFSGEENDNGDAGTGNFWDTENSGWSTSYEEGNGETGKTTAEMKTRSTFTDAGWDFDNIWAISSGYNSGYPNLDAQGTTITWDGSSSAAWSTSENWDMSYVPCGSDDVIIANAGTLPIIGTGVNADCNNLTINNGATFTVDDGGSLITHGSITNSGTINVNKNTTDDTWQWISVPVASQTATIFEGDYLQYWDESTTSWTQIIETTTALNPVQGYIVWHPTKASYTFPGTPYTGNQSIEISYNENGTIYDGANLVGNPYPSSIDWDLVSGYGSKYTWNGTDYDERTEEGTGSGNRYAAPMESFFIITNSTKSFSLNNTMRSHVTGTKSQDKSLGKGLILNASGENHSDEFWLVLNEQASKNFEWSRDAWKLLTSTEGVCQLWSESTDGKLAVDARPYITPVQLGFTNSKAGDYKIALKQGEGIEKAILEDTKTKTFHNLAEGDYEFSWVLSDSETRFKIHLSSVGIEEDVSEDKQKVRIYTSNHKLFIHPKEEGDLHVRITDLTGRIVLQKQIDGYRENTVKIPTRLRTGIYLATVIQNNQRYTAKVSISK
ncbi:MAG: T9SS type A sorting domain-containing protein [Bacteroidales bacterium]|nr:T9SS type A sorting domain-containing protein [Bacteroidales bacterium]MCF8333072.1 T9SS type A sorting domain-containing protein [Bacteroidales bacterium]